MIVVHCDVCLFANKYFHDRLFEPIIIIRAVFPELCETKRLQTAKVTFKVTKGHR